MENSSLSLSESPYKGLSDLSLRMSYRSDEHNLLEEFYLPCLKLSSTYRRAVGFFSSSSLSIAAQGLNAFLVGGGSMQLVASPILSAEDIAAINEGYANRRELEEQSILNALHGEFDELVKTRLQFLAWLIEYNRLDIKLAVRENITQPGIYHEKIGLFSDGKNFVAFTGSANESASGLLGNFESIDVYCSWKENDFKRAQEKKTNFTKLWDDKTAGLIVYSFPEACKKSLLRLRGSFEPSKYRPSMILRESQQEERVPKIPRHIKLRDYQNEAIENWFAVECQGTLKMATGSGKTITGLGSAVKLFEIGKLKSLVVIVPYKHLVTQWKSDCIAFNMDPISCFESRSRWESLLHIRLYNINAANIPFLSVLVTNSTFSSIHFQHLLKMFPKETLIIGDEVHNLGSSRLLSNLPENIPYRLGLSATPERWYDEVGTDGIFNYFGPILEPEFTLADGLKAGALVPYFYRPQFVELTEAESELYSDLSTKIGKLVNLGASIDGANSALQSLLIKRARLIATAENKIIILKELMKDRLDTAHTLFYCGDGSVESSDGEMVRHVDEVCRVLGSELGYRVTSYTAEDSLDEREDLKQDFESGSLQGLVAIRCLDEGVNIPAIHTAFILASSTNPRQFIQRRGRILRPHSNKTSAEIYDFIVLSPENSVSYHVERSLLRKELVRFLEFARLAKNGGEAWAQIVDLQKKYGLLDL